MDDASNLTQAQTLFWTGQKLDPNCPLYNMAVIIAIDGDLNPDRFERAFRKVVTKCDALMSVFEEASATPRRVVAWEHDWALCRIDLSGESDPKVAARAWLG